MFEVELEKKELEEEKINLEAKLDFLQSYNRELKKRVEVLTEEVKRPRLKIKQAEVLEAPRVEDLPIRNNNFVEEKGVEVSLKRLTDIISLKSDSISNFFAPFNPHKDRIFNGWELSLIFGD